MGQDPELDIKAELLQQLILTDTEFVALFNHISRMVVHQHSNDEDVPFRLYVVEYRPPEEVNKLKDSLAEQQNISRDELDKLLISTGGMIVPMAIFSPTEEQFNDKGKWIYEVGKHFTGIPIAVFAATSVWTVHKEKPEDLVVRPSEDPGRIERFMMLGATLSGTHRTEFSNIDRSGGKYAVSESDIPPDLSLNMLSVFWQGFADGHALPTDSKGFGEQQIGEA
jgi:hypothetical protein